MMDQKEKEKDFVDSLWDEEETSGKDDSMLTDLWDDGEFPDENEEEEQVSEEPMNEEGEEVVEEGEGIIVPNVNRGVNRVTYTRIPPAERQKRKKAKDEFDTSWIVNA